MDENGNPIIQEIKAEPGISLLMLFLFLLILGVLGAAFLVFRSSNKAINPQGINPSVTPRPLAAGEFTPILDKAWGLTINYNTAKQDVSIKKIDIIQKGIREDFRGANFSEFSFRIMNEANKIIYESKFPLVTHVDRETASGSLLPLPPSFETLSYIPFFKEGDKIAIYKNDRLLAEAKLPQAKKSAFKLIPPALAQDSSNTTQYGPYKILILGDNYTDEDKFKKDAEGIKTLLSGRKPFKDHKDFFEFREKRLTTPTPCSASDVEDLLKEPCKISNYKDLAYVAPLSESYASSYFSQIIVLVDAKGFPRKWQRQDSGNIFVIERKEDLVKTKGANGQTVFTEKNFEKMVVKHVLGAYLGQLYTRSVNTQLENNKLYEGIRSNCTDNVDLTFWKGVQNADIKPTFGCNGSMKFYAPYPPGDTPACKADGQNGQIYNGNSHTVMSNEWSDCGGIDFDTIEQYWLENNRISQFPPVVDSVKCTNKNLSDHCAYCELGNCKGDCFVYRGKEPNALLTCMKSSFKNKEEKDKNFCIGGKEGATNLVGEQARRSCNQYGGCYCLENEACGYSGCVPKNSQETVCGAWEVQYAASINEKNVCVSGKICSYQKCCNAGHVAYPISESIGDVICQAEKVGGAGSKCFKNSNCSGNLECKRKDVSDITGGCCSSSETWDGARCVGSTSNVATTGIDLSIPDLVPSKFNEFSVNDVFFTDIDYVAPFVASVKNEGKVAAPETTLTFCLDSVTCEQGKIGGAIKVVALNSGATRVIGSFGKWILTSVGDHTVTACVDLQNKVNEDKKANNCKTIKIKAVNYKPITTKTTKCKEDSNGNPIPLGYFCVKDGKNDNNKNGQLYASYGDCEKKPGDVKVEGERCAVVDAQVAKDEPDLQKYICLARSEHIYSQSTPNTTSCSKEKESMCDCGLFCVSPNSVSVGGGCCSDEVCEAGAWCDAVHNPGGSFKCIKKS